MNGKKSLMTKYFFSKNFPKRVDRFNSFILNSASEQKRGFILIMYLILLLSVSLYTFVWVIRRIASNLSFQYPPTYPGWLPVLGHVHLFFRCNPTSKFHNRKLITYFYGFFLFLITHYFDFLSTEE